MTFSSVNSGYSSRTRALPYGKIALRRSSTPVSQKHRSKDVPLTVTHRLDDQPSVHFNSPEAARLRPSLSSSMRLAGPRRLARSAHLHTLSNANRMQNRSKQGFVSEETDYVGVSVSRKPSHRRHIQIESPMTSRPKWIGEEGMEFFDDDSQDRGSASEAEDNIDSVVDHAPQSNLGRKQ